MIKTIVFDIVKAVLLDQHFVAGVGNIYANDALFLSGLHPSSPIQKLQLGGRGTFFCPVCQPHK